MRMLVFDTIEDVVLWLEVMEILGRDGLGW